MIGHHMKNTGTHKKKALIMPTIMRFNLVLKVICLSSKSIPSTDMYHLKKLLLRAVCDIDVGLMP